jgi:transcriptional regulator with XRE-family HTH domain
MPTTTTREQKRFRKTFPGRLQELRAGRSQRQFARDLGVFQQNINRYENGQVPHIDFMIVVSEKCNVSLNWLILGKGRKKAA